MLCRAKQAKGRLSGSHVEVTLENATPTSLDPSLRLMRLMGTTKSCVRGDFMGSPLGESGDGALGLSRAYSTRAEEMARHTVGVESNDCPLVITYPREVLIHVSAYDSLIPQLTESIGEPAI